MQFISIKHRSWTSFTILLALLISFVPHKSVRADENFYQIINDSMDAVNENFMRDRGYSVFVSYDKNRFLFDVGLKKESFLANLRAAGIALNEVDFVVLSHAHPDHMRGWSFLRREQASLPIYVPPGDGFSHIPETIEVNGHLQVTPNIFVIHTYDEEGSANIKNELSLLIKTKNGPFLFSTNAHTDFFAKVKKAEQISGQKIYFYSGHVARRITPDERIETMAKKMEAMDIENISPSHSTPRHNKIFKEVFGSGYVPAIVGKKVSLSPL